MIFTAKMWELDRHIRYLETKLLETPKNDLVIDQLAKATAKLKRLARIEELGLRLVQGGVRASESSTDKAAGA